MIFISIVSHGHCSVIEALDSLRRLNRNDEIVVVIKNNVSRESGRLKKYCHDINAVLIDEAFGLGFGANNNYTFNYCMNRLGMCETDWFLVLNPDVSVSQEDLFDLVDRCEKRSIGIASLGLLRSLEPLQYDFNARRYPGIVDFIRSYVFGDNPTLVDRRVNLESELVEWIAGSFMLFKAEVFRGLQGFDEGYFMYCEDLDICFRARQWFNIDVTYFHCLQALHLAKHANRKILSRHMVWHMSSCLRFLIRKWTRVRPAVLSRIEATYDSTLRGLGR